MFFDTRPVSANKSQLFNTPQHHTSVQDIQFTATQRAVRLPDL
jgi:hypothetical protein